MSTFTQGGEELSSQRVEIRIVVLGNYDEGWDVLGTFDVIDGEGRGYWLASVLKYAWGWSRDHGHVVAIPIALKTLLRVVLALAR